MGVLRLMGTLLRHPATIGALVESVPVFECLLIDYNANIHYVMQKTITELNEILYFTYYQENRTKDMLMLNRAETSNNNHYNLNLELSIEDLEDKLDQYNNKYHIGTTYGEISTSLSDNEKISDIIFLETINYTRTLITSLNKGSIKKVFLALDGTPSMAKIKEQKNRRYIGAHLNNIKEEIVKKYKFNNADIHQVDIFYFRSAICVGTKFMDKIQQALFHLNLDLDIDVSTINIKGEGEKKIIHAMNEYQDYNSFCIMSPDSDMLILIGLLSQKKQFDGKQLYNFRIDYQKNNQYQFIDLRKFADNLCNYYSNKINKQVTYDKMLDLFFMLVVFGNDFLPKLEPLNITKHFDFVCQTCLTISMEGMNFIKDDNLNYNYLLEFFKVINSRIFKMSIEQSLSEKYNNYHKLCDFLSISEEILKNNHHHPSLIPNNIDYTNFNITMKNITTAYRKLYNFLKNNIVKFENIDVLYNEIHANPNDSYLLLVLPKLLKFPNSDYNDPPRIFFDKLIDYSNNTNNFLDMKFRIKLMPKEYKYSSQQSSDKLTSYIVELEKLNKSLEPYRSIFRVANIDLISFDLQTGELNDKRIKYYDTYVKNNIQQREINYLVQDYLAGIEWLYQYYITEKHLEWSGWEYSNTQPPLIDDIIKYLENTPNCQQVLEKIIQSYPENTMGPYDHYLYVTPNEYTGANVSPNLSDVIHLIDGNGALYLNKCQIKWHEYKQH